jgi:predicted TIM-barrel fold metal-dependent hydrolase
MYHTVKVLDVHAHPRWPAAAEAYLARILGVNAPAPPPLGGGRGQQPGLTDDDFRLAAAPHVQYIDQLSIDVQLLGPGPTRWMGFIEPHLIAAWTRHVNDVTHKQVELYPRRFVGAAQIPMVSDAPDLSHCLAEIDRCVHEYGFVAVYASPDPAGRNTTPAMHEAYWFPLYEKCQAMGLPIIVHGTNTQDPRHRIIPLGYFIEEYWASQFLSHGDVFERYPELRVVISHCGAGLHRHPPTDRHLAQKDLRRNLFYDTSAYDLNFLEAGLKQHGVSQSLFGTEAPGSGGFPRPESGRPHDDLVPVIGEFPFLSEEDRVSIFNTNPALVFPRLAEVSLT